MGKKKKRKSSKNSNHETRMTSRLNAVVSTGLKNAVKLPTPAVVTEAAIDRIKETLHTTDAWATKFANLCANYGNLTFEQVADAIDPLNIQYNEALIIRGKAFSKAEIQQMNWIDLTAIKIPEMEELSKVTIRRHFQENPDIENQFYNLIPCFTSGIVQNVNRRIIYFKILDLNIEELTMTLYLQDYLVKNDDYLAGVNGTVKIKLMPGEMTDDNEYEQRCQVELLEEHDFPEIYREISQKQLGWNDLEQKLWQLTVIEHSEQVAAKQANLGISVITELTKIFLTYTSVTNYVMLKHRMKTAENKATPSEPRSQHDTNKTSAPHTPEKPLPERITRHVGKIRITSTTKPVRACKTTIRRYRLESWERRGHVRHLKSGKQVYIKPSTYHRKSLKNKPTGEIQPAATIKVHNEIP